MSNENIKTASLVELRAMADSGMLNKDITITLKRYNELLKAELELQRLDNAGVDNWEYNHLRYSDDEDY